MMTTSDIGLKDYLTWVTAMGEPFDRAITENLARYPVQISEFITSDNYLNLKNVYPEVIKALEEIYHPETPELGPIRIGTRYREVLLTGSLGCAKTYTSVLGILYGIYLLSCLRNPHALYDLDTSSEIVILFQSIRFQTGGVAYRLAREVIEGSRFFSKSFPKDLRVKNEIQLPNNIVIRPVSGELTAAIGMNVATVLLDEMSYMRFHKKSVNAEDGGEYDQARALYSTTRARIDSRFSKLGRYLIPMWLAGSARHEEDFIQSKIRELVHSSSLDKPSDVYVYNKRIWELKPWDYPSGERFRVFLGKGTTPPQVVGEESEFFHSENIVDVPGELRTAFDAQPINAALRDICGIPSREVGNFIVEIERTKSYFNKENIFVNKSCSFLGNDLPRVEQRFIDNAVTDRPWFCHLDLSRTSDSTGMAVGYVDKWKNNRPQITVAGLLEVPPVPGYVVPWDAIIHFLFRFSEIVPLYGVSADQVGCHYLWEHLVPYGYRISRVSDNPRSEMYHTFLNTLMEGDISIACHPKTIDELLALNVDERTGKVEKPADGSKDCADALVSLVTLMKRIPTHLHELKYWKKPTPPELIRLIDGQYKVGETIGRQSASKITYLA